MRRWLRRNVARLFYIHGVYCASHPVLVLTFSAMLIIGLSWPTVRLIWDGLKDESYGPTQFWEAPSSRAPFQEEIFIGKYGSQPFLRLEQLVINASNTNTKYSSGAGPGVIDKDLLLRVLNLQMRIESVSVSSDQRSLGLRDLCYKPFDDGRCLIHSALEYWKSDLDTLIADTDILRTLTNSSARSSFGTPLPLHSVFGGLSGLGSTNNDKSIGADSIVITYFLEDDRGKSDDNGERTSEIWDRIWAAAVIGEKEAEPNTDIISAVSDGPHEIAWRSHGEIKHLYYLFSEESDGKKIISAELTILIISYIIVFLYISLVLGRVELVKSKFGLGLAAVVMVFSSLLMSVGLSSMMGVTISLVPTEILPFLIIAVGVENIFVLTNAVVTTSLDLPVKERVGLGLSLVGGKMAGALIGGVSCLLVISMINIPPLQEFCLFASVSFVLDFFMQITFFTTILSIDIRRLELSDLHKLNHGLRRNSHSKEPAAASDANNSSPASVGKRGYWSLLIIIAIMLFIGLGLYGTSSAEGIFDSANVNESLWESSMSVTADALWDIINPSRADRYVEIRPPVHITIVYPGDIVPDHHGSEDWTKTDSAKSWRIQIDAYSFEISPFLFTGLIVLFLLLVTISCIFLSVLFTISTKALIFDKSSRHDNVRTVSSGRPVSKSSVLDWIRQLMFKSNHQPPSDATASQSSDPWMQDEARILSIMGSPFSDVAIISASSDGVVAWNCSDSKVRVWNIPTSRRQTLRRAYSNGTDYLSMLAVSGSKVILGSLSGSVDLLDLTSGSFVNLMKGEAAVSAISIAEDGQAYVIFADTSTAAIRPSTHSVDLQSVKLPLTRNNVNDQCSRECTSSCEGGRIAVGLSDGGILFLKGLSTPRVLIGHSCAVSALAFEEELGLLVSGSSDGEIILWDVDSSREMVYIGPRKLEELAADSSLPSRSRRSQKVSSGYVTPRASLDSTASSSTASQSRPSFDSLASQAGFTIRRVSSTLQGHSDSITYLSTFVRRSADPNFVSKRHADAVTLYIVSAGLDETVRIWEVTILGAVCSGGVGISNRDPPSVICSRLARVIDTPGCTTASLKGSVVVGARRVVDFEVDSCSRQESQEWARNRFRPAGTSGIRREGWWELWLTDIVDSSQYTRALRLGDDPLAGVSLPGKRAATKGEMVPGTSGTRQFKQGISADDSKKERDIDDNEWEDDDGSDFSASDDGDSDQEWEVLPVLGINSIKTTSWGIICGFGNFLKAIHFDAPSTPPQHTYQRRHPTQFKEHIQ